MLRDVFRRRSRSAASRRVRKTGSVSAAIERSEPRLLLSAVYHVALTGNDAAAGTADSPWRTLQRAANGVASGDTVLVHAGNYAGFDLRTDGTAASRITFRADPGVVIDVRNPVTGDGINLEGADYVTIEGFTVVNMPRAGIRSVVNQGVIVRGNVADANGTWGIFTGFSDDVLIENNTATRSVREHGIYVSNSGDRPVIRNNTLRGNNGSGVHMNGDLSAGGDGIITGAVVEGNVITDNGRAGGSAINADGVQGSVFRNNLLYENHAGGFALFRQNGAAGSSGNVVVNNTVVQASDGRWAVVVNDGSTGNAFFNNIFLTTHSFRGILAVSADSLSGLRSDYNVVSDRFSPDGENTRLTLAQWQAQTGQDTHSVVSTSAEVFADVAAADYRLKTGSPAVDRGVASFAGKNAPAVDRVGAARPQGAAWDAGAYEFVVAEPANRAPSDIALDTASVLEETPGATVGRITVTDPDAGDSHVVTVDDARFEVVGGVLRLKAGVRLDAEATRSLVVRVTATDAGGLSLTEAFTVEVINRPAVTSILLGYGNGRWISANELAARTASWRITGIRLVFDSDVRVDAADLAVVGTYGGAYGISGFSYDAAARAATWNLAVPVERDRLSIRLDGDGSGPDGNDGVAAAGTADAYLEGGDVTRLVDVLFGDADGDGRVTVADTLLVSRRRGTADSFADLDGDGDVDAADASLSRSLVGRRM